MEENNNLIKKYNISYILTYLYFALIGSAYIYYFIYFLINYIIDKNDNNLSNFPIFNQNQNSSNALIFAITCVGLIFVLAAVLYGCYLLRCKEKDNSENYPKISTTVPLFVLSLQLCINYGIYLENDYFKVGFSLALIALIFTFMTLFMNKTNIARPIFITISNILIIVAIFYLTNSNNQLLILYNSILDVCGASLFTIALLIIIIPSYLEINDINGDK